jgi:nitrogen fixation protein NifQ
LVDAALGGLPEERGYCAALAVEALQAAVKSAQNGHHPVTTMISADDEQAPRITSADPVYRLLLDSPAPPGAPAEDRQLFACLLAVAVGEPCATATALGLNREELADLIHLYFPAVTLNDLEALSAPVAAPPPHIDAELLDLLGAYLPHDADGWTPAPSLWLIRILAARAAHPGHLWRAMGLFARPELTTAIRRHLPALSAANSQGMRWKRFLYKQLCESAGGVMCKAPDCGVCSDQALCFAETLVSLTPPAPADTPPAARFPRRSGRARTA